MDMNNEWDTHFYMVLLSLEQLSNKYYIEYYIVYYIEIEAVSLLWFTKIKKVQLDTLHKIRLQLKSNWILIRFFLSFG